jgi:protein TonB
VDTYQEAAMLGSLIESKRTRAYRGALGGGAVSMLVHSALITGAVYATLHASGMPADARIIVPVEFHRPPRPPAQPPEPRSPVLPVPPVGPYTLLVPTAIPMVIPPPSSLPFDPASFTGLDTGVARVWGRDTARARVARAGSVYTEDVVEEPPERIGGPAPRYPEILRQAGIEGQVSVECVVDTAGRAEPGSVRVVSSTNPLFDAAAREAVAASLYRPGRLGGRAVRVRVRVPLSFRVARP